MKHYHQANKHPLIFSFSPNKLKCYGLSWHNLYNDSSEPFHLYLAVLSLEKSTEQSSFGDNLIVSMASWLSQSLHLWIEDTTLSLQKCWSHSCGWNQNFCSWPVWKTYTSFVSLYSMQDRTWWILDDSVHLVAIFTQDGRINSPVIE
jgi:hypothetical protein